MSRALRLRALAVVLGVCVPVGALALGSPPAAVAALQHPYISQLTGAPLTAPVPGPFTGPYGVTVDGSDNVWVADVGPGLMDKFDASGNFLAQGTGEGHWSGGYTQSVAFSSASGHLYVADSNKDDLWVLNADGSYNSDIPGSDATWGTGCCYVFTAADNSAGATGGDVYVSSSNGTVTRIDGAGNPANFSGSAAYIAANQLTGTDTGSGGSYVPFGKPQGVSVDSSGNVYVVDQGHDVIDEFDSTGVFVRKLAETPGGPFAGVEAVGVDPSSGHVYVLDGGSKVVDEFDSSGAYVGRIVGPDTPAHSLGGPRGVAVNSKGDIYVTDAANRVVNVFGPPVVVPDVTTGAASNVLPNTVTISGHLDSAGGGNVTGCEFEYGTDTSYGHSVPCVPAPPYSSPTDVSAGLTGLTPNTIYHYRLDATNANATNAGSDQTFTTPPAVQGVTTGAASNLNATSATLNGALEPNGTDATYHFEYGTDTSYGQSAPVPDTDAGSGVSSVPATANIAGLTPNTIYHYRLLATNKFGTTEGVDATFTTPGPPTINGESSEVSGPTVTLRVQIIPDGFETHYHFEYGTDTSYGHSAPVPDGSIAAGYAEKSVSVDPAGLALGTTYHFRVVATNAGSPTPVDGPDQTFTTHSLPAIDGEFVSNVLSTSTTLEARINPLGEDTHYYFQYGTSSCAAGPSSCTDAPAAPGTDIGSVESDQTVSVPLQSLTPATIYHYRVLAANALGTVEGPDHTFTTPTAAGQLPGTTQSEGCPNEPLRAEQPYGLGLPDCRAYEMVSPPDKSDQDVGKGLVRASVSGEAVTYFSKGAFAEPAGEVFADRYLASRGPGGWSNRNISPPYKAYETGESLPFRGLWFTSDLSKGLLLSEYFSLTSDSPEGYSNLYVADTGNSSYRAVTTSPPSGVKPYRGSISPQIVGVSSDLSRVVFQEYSYGAGLTPGASPKHKHVYEWANGHLSLVDEPPEGVTFEAEDSAGAAHGLETPAGDVWHAVSSDGSRVFFSAGDVTGPRGTGSGMGQLYVREVDRERTVEVSASKRTVADPNGLRPARYWGANTDGSRVFFTSKSELTNDANTGPADNAANLYEYDVETGVLIDLTVDTNTGDVNGAGVLGLVTASDDGSYVYFVAEGKLGEGATSGQPNLYLAHAGKVVFVSTLAHSVVNSEGSGEEGGDSSDWTGANPEGESIGLESGPGQHTVRVTPDGTRLAFESERSLTGYDNEPLEPKACGGYATGKFVRGPCPEVYLYDAVKGVLVCASCDPRGARTTGPAKLGGKEAISEATGGENPFYTTNNLSSDGSRLFFQSPDAFVPHDKNGRRDVYEYENGHVYPISDVAGNHDSFFLDASVSGNDVFIATADQLLPADTDFRIDVYDARVDGGFPVSVTVPVCDNGDSCKAPVSQQPGVFGAPASATFSGAGNLAPVTAVKPVVKAKAKRCKQGYVRKHGRCVKQKAKKARRSNGHSKRGRK
jgi:hypothetical protein